MARHFLRDDDLTPAEQKQVLALALEMAGDRFAHQPLVGPRTVAIMFDKSSTRTRVSFVTGVAELGGSPMVLEAASSQAGPRRVDRRHHPRAHPDGLGDRVAHLRPGADR